jgi:hypothetical protein
MEASSSVLAGGISRFNLLTDPPTPLFTDGVTAHTDYSTDFPFFGTPH